MHARKWWSSLAKVLEKVSEKTLGLLWMASEDQFTYHSVPIEAHFQYPKWNSLRKTLSLFDSLGFLEL